MIVLVIIGLGIYLVLMLRFLYGAIEGEPGAVWTFLLGVLFALLITVLYVTTEVSS